MTAIPEGLNLQAATDEKPKKAAKKGRTGKSRGFSLFDLTDDKFKHELLDEAMEKAEMAGMSPEEAMAAALLGVDNLTKDKVIAYGLRIQQWEDEAEAIKKVEARHKKRRERREKLAEGLRNRLVELMERDGRIEDKFESEELDLSFRSYPKLEVVDLNAVPEVYKVTNTPAPLTEIIDATVLKKRAIEAEAQYKARVEELCEAGKTLDEAQAEAKALLIPGVKVAPNWKVVLK